MTIKFLRSGSRERRILKSPETVVIGAQDADHFLAAELLRYRLTIGKHFAQARPGYGKLILRPVRTGLARRHAPALIAIERDVDLKRLDFHAAGGKGIEKGRGVDGGGVVAA